MNATSEAITHQKPKLLVVDDQAVNIRILHGLFRDDFDIYMANNGVQALETCRIVLPDIILLDVVMPIMDGHEVCRQLKADAKLSSIPVIFITAHYDEANEAYGFELGASDFIHKPINATITRARVQNQLLHKQQSDLLKSLALIDGLTGVANRRRFDTELETDWLQAIRNQTPISVLMIDVDNFKAFNDHYGHQAGDDCLRRVAQTIATIVGRPYDLVARYGGEEFICLLPNTDQGGARFIASQIERNIRELAIDHLHSTNAPVLTVSVGVATSTPTQGNDPQQLITDADKQLYNAKHEGRGRVCSQSV